MHLILIVFEVPVRGIVCSEEVYSFIRGALKNCKVSFIVDVDLVISIVIIAVLGLLCIRILKRIVKRGFVSN